MAFPVEWQRGLVMSFGLLAIATLGAVGLMTPTSAAPVQLERGWQVTIYYTAVESFHDRDELISVAGCPILECTLGTDGLGEYPRTFVLAVKDEGTGRITSGPHAGRYLNWAVSEGYWLDEAPRDQAGLALEPFRSAAADGLPFGTGVRLVDCGRGFDGGPPAPRVCEALRAGKWEIRDAFTPGYGGERHIDLYLGEEDVPQFTDSEFYTSFEDATLELVAPAWIFHRGDGLVPRTTRL